MKVSKTGEPPNGWFLYVFVMENPRQKWMMTWGTSTSGNHQNGSGYSFMAGKGKHLGIWVMDAMVNSISFYKFLIHCASLHWVPHRLIQGLQRRKAWGSRFHELFSRASQLLGSQGSQQDLNATPISSQQHHNSGLSAIYPYKITCLMILMVILDHFGMLRYPPVLDQPWINKSGLWSSTE